MIKQYHITSYYRIFLKSVRKICIIAKNEECLKNGRKHFLTLLYMSPKFCRNIFNRLGAIDTQANKQTLNEN